VAIIEGLHEKFSSYIFQLYNDKDYKDKIKLKIGRHQLGRAAASLAERVGLRPRKKEAPGQEQANRHKRPET
jgi:hypothetical protein